MAYPEVSFGISRRMPVAYVERRGSYKEIGDSMKDLEGWLDSKGIASAGRPFCLFYDNPGETPAEELKSEACIPVTEAFKSEGRFKFKVLDEISVAETRHAGPPEEFGRTYGPFLEGLLKQGYRLDGPTREYFATVEGVRGPGSGILIQQPISKR